jgi:hypothetical protein
MVKGLKSEVRSITGDGEKTASSTKTAGKSG